MTQAEHDLESQALRAEQSRYQDLFEFAPVAYLVTDAAGVIKEANRTAAELLGVNPQHIVGKPLATSVPIEGRKQFRTTLIGLGQGSAIVQWELELERRDGTKFHAELTAARAHAGPDPGTLRWMVRDVSERVESDRRLRTLASLLEERVLERTDELERQRAHLEAIVDQLPAGLVIAEAPSARILSMNDEARQIMSSFDDFPSRLRLERALLHGEVILAERLEFRRPDRDALTIELSMAPVRDQSGGIVSAVAIVQDVTGNEQRERAEREFVTNAAHELQSPLAAITSAVDVLQSGAKDTEERDLFLGHIVREAQRLGRLVRSLLTLARTQTGIESPRSELIELCPMVEVIAERVKPADGVLLDVDCPEDLAVVANRELLEQAISNLARNAAKHTEHGSIRIAGRADDGDVVISVADTGTGIAADALPRVFDRFYRADSQHEGFGLGLSIVHAAVEAMDGELGISSTPAEGTTVTIKLPARARMVGP